jgi:hypothetical protein
MQTATARDGSGARPYDAALEATRATIYRRSRRYRTLVILVALLPPVSIIAAITLRSWLPLVGALLPLPLCTAYLSLDLRLVARWRRRVVGLWADGALDIDAFRQAARAMRTFPTQTVASMLDSLPSEAAVPDDRLMSLAIRRLLAQTLHAIDERAAREMTAVAVAATLSVAGVAAAIGTASWLPALSVILAPMLVSFSRRSAMFVLRRSIPTTMRLIEAGIDPAVFATEAARLDWRRTSGGERDQLIAALRGRAEEPSR